MIFFLEGECFSGKSIWYDMASLLMTSTGWSQKDHFSKNTWGSNYLVFKYFSFRLLSHQHSCRSSLFWSLSCLTWPDSQRPWEWSQQLSNIMFVNIMKSFLFVRIVNVTSRIICIPSSFFWKFRTCYNQTKRLTCWAGRESGGKKKKTFGRLCVCLCVCVLRGFLLPL